MHWWIGEFVVSFFDVTNRLNVPCFLKSGLKGLNGFLWYSHFSTFRLAIVANTDGGQYCPQAVPNNRWSYYDGTEMIGDDITIECHGVSAKKGKNKPESLFLPKTWKNIWFSINNTNIVYVFQTVNKIIKLNTYIVVEVS